MAHSSDRLQQFMKTIVLTKQVKIGEDVKCDFAGIEAAVRLKEQMSTEVSVLVLGEEKSGINQVRDAIAMGCDFGEAIITDNFDELDAWSCAQIFAGIIKEQDCDLVISGGFPTDADTVAIGLLTASMLGLPFVSHAESIFPSDEDGNSLSVDKRMEERLQLIKVKMPCLASALPHPEDPIYKTVAGINRAYAKDIPIIHVSNADKDKKIFVKGCAKVGRRKRGESMTAISTDEAVKAILDRITAQHLL